MKTNLDAAKAEYQAEIENQLLAIEEEKAIQAFDRAFESGKPALPVNFKVKKVRIGKSNSNKKFLAYIESLSAPATLADIFQWLRTRSTAGSETAVFNNLFVTYCENVLSFSGNDLEKIGYKIQEKAKANNAFAEISKSYKIFDLKGRPNAWYYKALPDAMQVLESMNIF